MRIKDITVLALCSAILIIAQIALAPLANVELVSLLVILYSLYFRRKVFYIIYLFAIMEGLIYGFGVWWLIYLYVWSILAIVSLCFAANRQPVFWAIISGMFGLSFGALCSIPYFFIGGWAMGFSYFISGIPFDLLHGAGNFMLALLLLKPLLLFFGKLQKHGIYEFPGKPK